MSDAPRVLNRRDILGEIPLGAVYVGRPTPWGNPFNVGKDGNLLEVIDLYRRWFCASDRVVREAVKQLRGLDLVCWCAPRPCHADVLLDIVNRPYARLPDKWRPGRRKARHNIGGAKTAPGARDVLGGGSDGTGR